MNWRAYEMDMNIEKRNARAEGLKEGEYKQLIRLACKKKVKGFSPEEAAEQLESDAEQIRQIYEAIDTAGTFDDVEVIYRTFIKAKCGDEE